MGLLSRFKNMVFSDITCPEKYKNNLVYMYKSGNGKIKIGNTLIVKSNYVALIVAKDRVTDLFFEGKHKLNLPFMPKTTKKLKLDKIKVSKKTKKKKTKKNFKADIYFIRLDKFTEEKFNIFNKLLINDDKFGKFKARVTGEATFSVVDAEKFLTALLTLWGKVNNGMGKAQAISWLGQNFYRNLDKRNLSLKDLTGDVSELCSRITGDLTGYANSLGIELDYIIIRKVVFPKKLARKIGNEGIDYNSPEAFHQEGVETNVEQEATKAMQDDRLIFDDSHSEREEPINEKPENFKEELDNFRKGEYNLLKSVGLDTKTSANKKTATIVKSSVNNGGKDYKICPKCGSIVGDREFVCPNCRAVVIN